MEEKFEFRQHPSFSSHTRELWDVRFDDPSYWSRTAIKQRLFLDTKKGPTTTKRIVSSIRARNPKPILSINHQHNEEPDPPSMPARVLEPSQPEASEPSSESDQSNAPVSRAARQGPRSSLDWPYPPPFANTAQAVIDVVDQAPVASDSQADNLGLTRAAQLRSLAQRRDQVQSQNKTAKPAQTATKVGAKNIQYPMYPLSLSICGLKLGHDNEET